VPLHFGLGEATAARIDVIAPGETVSTLSFEEVVADRLYTLRDGKLEEKRRFLRR
jgi:hypothetical protein